MFDMVELSTPVNNDSKNQADFIDRPKSRDGNNLKVRINEDNNTISKPNTPHIGTKSRQNSLPRREEAMSPPRLSRSTTPTREKIASDNRSNSFNEGGGGGNREAKTPRLLRRSNTGGKLKTDGAGNMEGFTDSHTTDWMIGKLQREQMAAVVNTSGQQVHIPLGKDGEISWKSLPELNTGKSESKFGNTSRPQSPVISYTEFDELFKSYSNQIPDDVKEKAKSQQESTKKGGLFIDTGLDDHPTTSNNAKSLPSLSTSPIPQRKSRPKTAVVEATQDESQRILDSMQPHLDAFVAVNVSKKANNIQMVQKMLTGLKKNPASAARSTTEARNSRRPGGVSEVGKVAVRSFKHNNRVRAVDGFRNVFMDPESSDEESDDDMGPSEESESEISSSEDLSDSDSEEEVAVVEEVFRGSAARKRLSRKKTDRKLRVEDSSVIQQRQMAIWEVLEVKTEDRVKLMNKYSSYDCHQDFRQYMKLWTEVALLVVFRQELRKVFQWYQRGLLSVPDENHESNLWIFQDILDRIPPLLKGTYTLNNKNKKSVRAEAPYFVLEKARGILTFDEEEFYEMGPTSLHCVLTFLHSTVKYFDQMLHDKLSEAEATLHDIIPFGSGTCKEWLMSKKQKFPAPKL